MLNKDEIKGKAKEAMGTIKENLGWLTDDHKAEDEGKANRIEGKVEQEDAKMLREAENAEEELLEREKSSQTIRPEDLGNDETGKGTRL
jgi:uncharacterized protein YjbJ (UPF0337 family)